MAIPSVDHESFTEILRTHLSPSSPIQSSEHLYGREMQLRTIDQALHATGRHIFIYGDRGVGKTSIAQTAAFLHQSADRDPILVACTRGVTFYSLIRSIARKLHRKPLSGVQTVTKRRGLAAAWMNYENSIISSSGDVPQVGDMNEAVDLVSAVGKEYSKQTLIVVDEFDLVTDPKEKELFADFIKQIGDQRIPVHFIFCGIGESLDQLLGAHGSCFRYLEGVEVPRLYFEGRFSIIDGSAAALGVKVTDEQRFRVAAISDGFPYYIHLICEKLYWELFNAPGFEAVVMPRTYGAAIRAAINGIQQELRRAYDKATAGKADALEPILWAAADHSNLIRNREQIFTSYLTIAKRLEQEPVDKRMFGRKLGHLRSEACGKILVAPRRGLARFRESMLRGYVRLRAEAEGILLATDYGEIPEERITARSRKQLPIRHWRHQILQSED